MKPFGYSASVSLPPLRGGSYYGHYLKSRHRQLGGGTSTGFCPGFFPGTPPPLDFLENFQKIRWNFMKIRRIFIKISWSWHKIVKILQNPAKSAKNFKKSKIFDICDFSFGAYLVDLVKRFPTSIWLQKSVSIQPRTSLLKFEGGGFSAPVIHFAFHIIKIPLRSEVGVQYVEGAQGFNFTNQILT